MTGYAFDSAGVNSSALAGGNMTPALPAGYAAGKLALMHAGVNSISLPAPTVLGWTILTPNVNAKGEVIYARIAQLGDVSPTFQFDASHQAFSRIACFSGDIYTDLSTIVVASSDRGTSTQGDVAVASVAVPPVGNCLLLRGGHCLKSTTNNAGVFLEWTSNPGVLTKISTDIVQSGAAIAGTWWYWAQTTPLGMSTDLDSLTFTEASSGNTQGWTIILQPATTALPAGESYYPDSHVRRSAHAAVQQFWQVPATILALPVLPPPQQLPDLSVPPRRPMPLSALQTPTNTLPLGTDRILQPALWDYEWDKPSLPLALRAECCGLTANELFAAQNLPPYLEYNWPVPPGARQPQRGFEQSLNKLLKGQDFITPSGPQKEMWDPPRGTRRPVANLGFESSGLSLYYFFPVFPVGSTVQDLPPYSAKRLRQDYQQSTNPAILSFASTIPPFQACTDLPPRRPKRLFSYSYDYSSSLLYRNLVVLPPGDQWFENPRVYRPRFNPALHAFYQFPNLNPPLPPPGPPASSGQVAGPGGRIILMPKKVGETVIRPFDFISRLGATERILSAVVAASVYSGIDGSPQLIINGSAAISGTIVNQSLTGGILGVIYELLCTVNTSLGQRLEMSAFWVVEPDLP